MHRARLSADAGGDRRFAQSGRLSRPAQSLRLRRSWKAAGHWFQIRPLVRHAADAAGVGRGKQQFSRVTLRGGHGADAFALRIAIKFAYPPTSESVDLSIARSTRSSSCPRRTMCPVAEITL